MRFGTVGHRRGNITPRPSAPPRIPSRLHEHMWLIRIPLSFERRYWAQQAGTIPARILMDVALGISFLERKGERLVSDDQTGAIALSPVAICS